MSPRKDSLYLFVLAAIALAGVIVLVAMARPVPQELWTVAGLIFGGIVGVARQDSTTTQSVTLPNAIAPNINGTSNAAPLESMGGPDVTG